MKKLLFNLYILFIIPAYAIGQAGNNDTSFDPGSDPNSGVLSIALQEDGKIISGGFFTSHNAKPANKIAGINQNGTLDETFTAGTSGDVFAIAVQDDQKIVAAELSIMH
ncbi:MAG: delta-60 repeat domain-containing protein [Cytophagaceae bacterium]